MSAESTIYMERLKEELGDRFWNVYVGLNTHARNFHKSFKDKEIVGNLLCERKNGYSEQSEYILKGILQNSYLNPPSVILWELDVKFDSYRDKFFNFLDALENPYKYIYSPMYFWFTSGKERYMKNDTETGINDFSHFLAKEYALYKIGL